MTYGGMIPLPNNPTIDDMIRALSELPGDWLFYVDWESAIAPPSSLQPMSKSTPPQVILQ
jgi:hypothetical protein